MLLGTKEHKKEEHQGHKRELKSIKQIYNTSFKINAMQYPLISEYVRAIQNAELNLNQLGHLTPVFDNHDEPYHCNGASAVVFKMKEEQTGKYYALKCFTEEREGRAEVYPQIADALKGVNSMYITSMKYMEKELFVDCNYEENEFAVLQMDWIDGETMETYVADNYHDQDAMSMLSFRFCEMAAWLRSQPFAHGDIKPKNIMVRPDGTLTLIDYDDMFVPTMKRQKSPVFNTNTFSHPLRTVDDFDENIDDFSLASIALSLKALSLKPSLWNAFGTSERLLFSANDYIDLSKSKVLAAMQELLTDEDMKTLLSLFLLASAKKDLSMCSFKAFIVRKPNEMEGVLKQGKDNGDGKDNLKRINMKNSETIEKYRKAAEQGDAEAQWRLGESYESGYGVKKDFAKAVEWYKRSADQDNAAGKLFLGRCYMNGQGVEKDLSKAVNLFKQSAKQGHAVGQWVLGLCFYCGEGVEKDYVKAAKLYKRSAEQGSGVGQWRLATCYLLGKGVEQDYAKATEWLIKSAYRGNAEGQWRLAQNYFLGLGVNKDFAEAVGWFRKAAEQGHAEGQWRLGHCYQLGQGVEKDCNKAAALFRKSAEQGHAVGQRRLAYCYEKGIGVPQDIEKAREWYLRSANKGDATAKAWVEKNS